jgi:CheY-like chemotaxis protein
VKLLIVEDDKFLLRAYEVTAEKAGFSVIVAADGAEGISRALDERPDVILTDVQMPKLDGMGLIKALKSDPGTANIPIIVFSSSVVPEEAREFVELGAVAFYAKSTTALSDVVHHLRALCP